MTPIDEAVQQKQAEVQETPVINAFWFLLSLVPILLKV
jgi:hypothetical protein